MSEYVKIKRKLYDELVETKSKYEVMKSMFETMVKVYQKDIADDELKEQNK